MVVPAADGEAIVPAAADHAAVGAVARGARSGWRPVRSRLTTREWEIIDLLTQGDTTQRIAERLVLSPTTVYSHVKSVLRKLGVHSRRDAIAAADGYAERRPGGNRTGKTVVRAPAQYSSVQATC